MTLKECFIDLIQACMEEDHTPDGQPDCEICCALGEINENFPELFEVEDD